MPTLAELVSHLRPPRSPPARPRGSRVKKNERLRINTIQNFPAGSSGPAFSLPLFAVSAAREGDTCVIQLQGELDLFDCPRLEHALHEAEATHATRILLDLEELTFIDAAGLGTLVAAWHRSVSDGNRLQVTPGRGSVADIFRLTAIDTVLSFTSVEPLIA